MPKVPKVNVFCLSYIFKIDQTEGCSETLDHFSSLHTLDHCKYFKVWIHQQIN